MKTSKHPYAKQPDKAFWKKTVSSVYPLDIANWYRKKFPISELSIATGGSCFAQHIGNQLKNSGFHYLDVEPAPKMLASERHLDYGYGMYSARYGNIYSSRQLLQLARRAFDIFKPVETYWQKEEGYVDCFRPTIEPEPFSSIEELEFHQAYHLQCVKKLFKEADVFIFTLGLTEVWQLKEDGAVFPIAPGVSGGMFDAEKYQLLNLTFANVYKDMKMFFNLMAKVNKNMRFILTVSPVPLMATATDDNVLVATTYSKSVLRAVAGQLASEYDNVDYFPSYEIISAPAMRGQFYNPDMRTVSHYGVEHVMQHFFKEHQAPSQQKLAKGKTKLPASEEENDDVRCDEELLSVFGV